MPAEDVVAQEDVSALELIFLSLTHIGGFHDCVLALHVIPRTPSAVKSVASGQLSAFFKTAGLKVRSSSCSRPPFDIEVWHRKLDLAPVLWSSSVCGMLS